MDCLGPRELELAETPPRKKQKRLAMNGALRQPEVLGPRGLIDRIEFVRLLEQAVRNLGYASISEQLEVESGITYQNPVVNAFKQHILSGEWDAAVALLGELAMTRSGADKEAKFLLLEQKYLESLSKGSTALALACLQNELSPLCVNTQRLHRLASCVLCRDAAALQEAAGWLGITGGSRERVLSDLEDYVPRSIMLPNNRLEELLEQALSLQMSSSPYVNAHQAPVSLLSDYRGSREHIPSTTRQVLLEHADEVWHVAFSPDGERLASGSRDMTAMIWEIDSQRQLVHRHTLDNHSGPVTFVAWSPDSALLATTSTDRLVMLWNAETGDCLRSLDQHLGAITCLAWMPDGKRLVMGGADKVVSMFDVNGAQLRSWKGAGTQDMAITPDGRLLFTQFGEEKVRMWDLDGHVEAPCVVVQEHKAIVSLCASSDGRRMLINLVDQEIHLWGIPPREAVARGGPLPSEPMQRLKGPRERQSRYVTRSCFGGFNESFVLSGSEECKVFVWHANSGELVASLEGHSGTVNAVSWNPVDHHMFASASDDRSIHIWGPGDARSPMQNGLSKGAANGVMANGR